MRTKTLTTALATLLSTLLAAPTLAACSGADKGLEAATAAAERYVDLIASGDTKDLNGLHNLEIRGADDAKAAKQLTVAEERIGDPTVSDAKYVSNKDRSVAVGLEKYVSAKVTYRLGGHRHQSPIVMGQEGGPTDEESSWVVLTPLLGQVSWVTTPLSGFRPDVYIGHTRQDILNNVDQPLYPGVYPVRAHWGSLYTSGPTSATVLAGKTNRGPTFDFRPTAITKRLVRRAVLDAFKSCAVDKPRSACPVYNGDLNDLDLSDGWWGGLTIPPKIVIRGVGFTLSGGRFVYRRGGAHRSIDFTGKGVFSLTGADTPTIDDDLFITLNRAH